MEEIIVNLFKDALENLNYGWVILFMTIESSFIPFPSEVVMIPAAYMAYDGEMSCPMIVICGTIGALLGAFINYTLSRYLGRPIVYKFANSRFGHMCLIDAEKVEQAEKFFDKHGAISTLIGRMIPAIRQLISIPAGLAKMSILPFSLYTAIGAAVWNCILVAIGYYLGRIMPKEELIQTVSHYSHIIGYSAIALVVLILAFLIYKGAKNPNSRK
ncbi:MAG: DedA family protein [Prevotellaceae bacterium]|nr:DedA family protein [Candidatus Minthosoma equi]